jgi:hypothetical protein
MVLIVEEQLVYVLEEQFWNEKKKQKIYKRNQSWFPL